MPIDSSLIIITFRRAEVLSRTLEALTRQTRKIGEIVVVDNGPDADTRRVADSFLETLPLRYVVEERRGYGYARNRGLAEARGDVLYFLDDDCVAEPDWAEVLWNLLSTGATDLACGSRICSHRDIASRLEYLSTDGGALSPKLAARAMPHLSTSNLILRREVAEKVGPFDETLVMCEDRDFTARAGALGFRQYFEPKARVTHYSNTGGMSGYLRKMRHYGCGTSQYFLRRPEEPLARYFPRRPVLRLLLMPLLAAAGTVYLVRGNLPHAPDSILLSPLLFVGQFAWHWGGYEATRQWDRSGFAPHSTV